MGDNCWHKGFCFPWEDDVLLPRLSVFGDSRLQRQSALLGRTETQVVCRVGAWTFVCLTGEGKFPDVERVLPSEESLSTSWEVSSRDAAYLIREVPRLPMEIDHPEIILDLGASVRIVSRCAGAASNELDVWESPVAGKSLRLLTDPRYLVRALKLGFRRFDFAGATVPIRAQDSQRLYLWMPLAGTVP